MGKTETGAIWLDKKLLSPYNYYQYWRNTDDRDVIKFLKIFTDLEVSEINNLQNKNINDLKILLANETTTMLHGKNAANKMQNKLPKKLFLEILLVLVYQQLKLKSNELINKLILLIL